MKSWPSFAIYTQSCKLRFSHFCSNSMIIGKTTTNINILVCGGQLSARLQGWSSEVLGPKDSIQVSRKFPRERCLRILAHTSRIHGENTAVQLLDKRSYKIPNPSIEARPNLVWPSLHFQLPTSLLNPVSGHYYIRGPKGVVQDESHVIALGPKYDEHVKATGKKVSTLLRDDYPVIRDNNNGRLIVASTAWRPRRSPTDEHSQRIRDALEQQQQAAGSKKRRLSNAQGEPAAKRLNTGGGSFVAGPSRTQP